MKAMNNDTRNCLVCAVVFALMCVGFAYHALSLLSVQAVAFAVGVILCVLAGALSALFVWLARVR